MRPKMAVSAVGFIILLSFLLPGLVIYISLGINGKKPLTLTEWQRFTNIITWAGLVHAGSNGGYRAWEIAGESLSDPVTQVSLPLKGRFYSIPLPPSTIRKSCTQLVAGLPKGLGRRPPGPTVPQSCQLGAEFPSEFQSFITIASPSDLDQYTQMTLSAAGWLFKDRLGSAWIYQKNEARLTLNLGSYLTIYISDFSLSLTPARPKR